MKKTETLTEKLTKTDEGMRLYRQERTILEATELICLLMHEQGVSNKELARRLGKSRKHIMRLLDGQKNVTLRTLSDIFTALNRTVQFQDGPLDKGA